jgi:hypothetical protein
VPGDSLVSSISLGENLPGTIPRIFRPSDRWSNSPVRSYSILTVLDSEVSSNTFRPSYCDINNNLYSADNVNWNKLLSLPEVSNTPDIDTFENYLRRPWIDTIYFGLDAPTDYMPDYGMEVTRLVGHAGLLLNLDYTIEEKRDLTHYLIQYGIDLYGCVEAGHPGWTAWGGHGNGRKFPIVFAGTMLDETQMAGVSTYNPSTSFSEDMQTMYDTGWTGASAVFAGHRGANGATASNPDWGRYEHLHPSDWPGITGENYRRHSTSHGWIGESLALRLMQSENSWDHDSFFDYTDRWMTEDDTVHIATILAETGMDYSTSWSRQGYVQDAFVEEMWAEYRN